MKDLCVILCTGRAWFEPIFLLGAVTCGLLCDGIVAVLWRKSRECELAACVIQHARKLGGSISLLAFH